MDLAVKCYDDDVEMAVTVIVGGKGVEEFSVLVHLGVYVPTDFGSVGATLALAGKGRGEMAEAKCSDWVRFALYYFDQWLIWSIKLPHFVVSA